MEPGLNLGFWPHGLPHHTAFWPGFISQNSVSELCARRNANLQIKAVPMSVNLHAGHWAQPLTIHRPSPTPPKTLPPGGGEFDVDSHLTASFNIRSSLPKRQISTSCFLDNTEWIKNIILFSRTLIEAYHVSDWFYRNIILIRYRHGFQGAHSLAGRRRHTWGWQEGLGVLYVYTSQPRNPRPESESCWRGLASFGPSSARVFLLQTRVSYPGVWSCTS